MHEDHAFKTPRGLLAGEKLENPSRLRARVCLCVLLVGFAAVGVKLIDIQILRHDFWVKHVDEQRKSAITIQPTRGTIYDRNMIPLARSIVHEVLCVAPPHVTDPHALAKALAPYAKMSAEKIVEKIRSTNLYLIYLRRGLDIDTVEKIRSMELPGVEFRSEFSRYYPKGLLASNLMGFANLENKGLEGIEYKFDSHLAGEAGKQIVIKDNSRREIVPLAQTVKEASDGNHIVLTIDEIIQHNTEKALEGIVAEFSPESVSAVVLDPKTGRVLAMACKPTFDPNKPSTYTAARLRNRVIADVFEPGSAFKPIAAAAALEGKVISPEDRIYCELGSMRYHGHTYNDVHPLAEVSFADVIVHSSNIGMIKVVSLLPAEFLYGYIKRFGFGELTGIGLPGEATGIIRPPSKWSGLSMGSLPIGQEISMTALQLAQAFSTIANGGKLMRPYAVSAILSPKQEVLKEIRPQVIQQVIQPETAKTLANILERVVTSGTGKAAFISGYKCAGKTGTAQKADLSAGGYFRDKYVAVFAGFVPADNPAACMVVVADSPKGKHYGGQVAAPAFREIARKILNHFEIPPTEPEEDVTSEPEKPAPTLRIANRKCRAKCIVKTGLDGPCMPDVSGKTMTVIINSLSDYFTGFEFDGSGVACQQSPGADERIVEGQVCRVDFKRVDEK